VRYFRTERSEALAEPDDAKRRNAQKKSDLFPKNRTKNSLRKKQKGIDVTRPLFKKEKPVITF